MSTNDLLRLLEATLVIGGTLAIIYAVFKNTTVKATIQSQKELIDTLSEQVSQLRQLHIDNEKDIAELRGQVSVYKELPLKELAESMESIAKGNALISETQDKILAQLKKNQVKQVVKEQNVAHQTINEKI